MACTPGWAIVRLHCMASSSGHVSHESVVPIEVTRLVAAVEPTTGPLRLQRPFSGTTWVGIGAREVVYLAPDEPARRRLRVEYQRMQWAREHGVPVPDTVSATDDVLVTARVTHDEARGVAYIREAIRIADLIAAAGPLPAGLQQGGTSWRAPRRTLARRLARGVRARLDWREFLAVRRSAFALSSDTMSHGDYHRKNLLFVAASGRIVVVDWEYAGLAPRGTDLLTMWPQTRDVDDRAALLDAALVRSGDRRATAVLHHWLAIRWFAEVATGAPRSRLDAEKIARARRRVTEARAHARAWGE